MARLRRAQIFTGPLRLVNREHPLKNTFPAGLVPVDSRWPGILLERRAARLLAACVRAAGGTGGIVPVSGWRSQAEQRRIWDAAMAENGGDFTRKYVAVPGCSEHQTGLAIDLGKSSGPVDFIRPVFPCDGVCGRFRRLAPGYGFIERYQRGKEAITGIAPEPWHFRYVGAPHAQLMVEHGLCLEEYRDLLRQGPQSCLLPSGKTVRVFYVPSAGEVTGLELPDGRCQVSGDNVDGFIVTIWEDCT